MECREILFTGHALRRMFEQEISHVAVREVVSGGEVIAEYLEDRPFPSCLLLGTGTFGTLHVVAAKDAKANRCFVVTAYLPDPALWEEGFKKRRSL